MSGIAALFSRDGSPADARAVAAMLTAIPYRGPDGMRVWAGTTAVLGHAKLAITAADEAEIQPVVSPRSGCAVVADARLDNRERLLSLLPRCPRDAGDGELILRAYETWGLTAPDHLEGDFAFVVWDPAADRLVCARDGAGQRSLYYRHDRHTFAAASEVHQLLQDPAVPFAPNDDRIREALVPLTLHRNEKVRADTYFAGIQSVFAGELLVVDRHSLRTRRFWQIALPQEIRYRHRQEYADHFRALLFEAVRTRLRTSHPLGVMLSGGLDSTSIACVAQELYRAGRSVDTGFATVSIVYDDLDCDERAYIDATRRKYGFTAHHVAADPGLEAPMEGFVGFRERPDMATSGFETLLREASRLGMRTVLTGEVADACVRGSPLVADSLLRSGRAGAALRYLQEYRALTHDSWRKIALLYVIAPLLPLPLQRALRMRYVRRIQARVGHHALPSWMPMSLRDALAGRNYDLLLAEERDRLSSSESRHWDLLGLTPPEAMALPVGWPVELARPFADRRLQEFLLAVPPPEKYEPHPAAAGDYASAKQLLRRGLAGILPEEVRTRTAQTHFNAAAVERVRVRWPVLERWFGPGGRSRIAERSYVDADRFWARLQSIRDGRVGMDFLYVNYCLGLESWLRAFEQPRHQAVMVRTPWSGRPADVSIDREAVTVGRETVA